MDDHLRYPVGPQPELPTGPLAPIERFNYIQQLAELPAQLTAAASRLGPDRLRRPYRPGGWNGRQVIHHVADSHLHSYQRFKQALTLDNPDVQPYDEVAWAELPDVAATAITVSLELLGALHRRWVVLLHHLTEAQWQRTFYHLGSQRTFTLDQALVLYAWHGRHHLAHLGLLEDAAVS